MRAAFYESTGAAEDVLHIGELDEPVAGPGEVVVRIGYSAVHPSDVKTRSGARGPMAFSRVVPHSDGSGRIVAVGEGVDPARVGTRVWIWNAAWKRAHGTASELIALPGEQAVLLPEGASLRDGATLGIPAITAHRSLFSDGDISGQSILITGGAGTVGSMAIQMAKRAGARVITTVSNQEKAAHAKSLGADCVVNYRDEDAVAQIQAGAGGAVDRIVEVEFGGNLGMSQEVLVEGGVVATYGSMAAPEPQIPFYPLMFKNMSVRMVFAYTIPVAARRQAEADISTWLADGSLKGVIADEFSLEDSVAAHVSVEAGRRIGVTLIKVAEKV